MKQKPSGTPFATGIARAGFTLATAQKNRSKYSGPVAAASFHSFAAAG
jgi:hypothetical protein